MAIKYNNQTVTNINYDSHPVKKVVLDGNVRWEKPFALSASLETGCTVVYNRYSTLEPSASTGTITTADTIFNDDVLRITYTPVAGYEITSFTVNGSAYTSGADYTVHGDVAVACETQGVAKTISVTVNTGVARIIVDYTNIYGHETSVSFTNNGSVSDAWQGTSYSWTATYDTGYEGQTSGSGTIGNTNVIAPTASLINYTITWKYLSAYPDTWATATETYHYGDIPSRSSPSTVTSGTSRKVFDAWDDLSAVTASRTITATYTHQGYYTLSLTNCTRYSGDTEGWYAYGTTKTTTVKADSGWSFAGSVSQDTKSISATVPGTASASPAYFYIAVQAGTGCSANANSGFYTSSTKPASITWTPTTYYSFAAGATQTNYTNSSITSTPATYSATPTNYKAANISGDYCTADKNKNTYYAAGSKITWTANENYSFNGSSTKDTVQETISAGGSFSRTPGYLNISVTATRSTFKVTKGSTTYCSGKTSWTGIVPKESTITWTADTDYSFAAGTTQDATRTATVVLGTLSYSRSADYKNITVSATHCSANVESGYRHLGDTITWTRDSASGEKWSFSSSNVDDATRTATIVVSTASYSQNASNHWYYATITPATNCTANKSTGWHLAGTTVTFTTTTATSSVRYSFSNTTSDSYTTTGTVDSANKSINSGTVYTWYNITVSATNCTANVNSGWRLSGTTITWTIASGANYSFAAGSTQDTTETATVNAAGTYSKSPTNYRAAAFNNSIYATATSTSYSSSAPSTSVYYPAGTTITWTAAEGYSFDGEPTTTTGPITAGGTFNAPMPTTGNVTVTATRSKFTIPGYCTTPSTSWTGAVAAGTVITWTADSGYSFAEGTTQDATRTATVAIGTISYSKSADYKNITVTGTNCTPTISSGYRHLGDYIYWNASTGTNLKYSFNNTPDYNPSDAQRKSSGVQIVASTSSYSKTPSYVYYNVDIAPTTGYSASPSADGYYISGKSITFTAPANSDTKRYSFSTTDSTVHTQTKSVSSAGQTIVNDTATVWMNCTFIGTRCTANLSSGWQKVGTAITWTGNTGTNYKYSMNNSPVRNPTDAQRSASGGTVTEGTTAYSATASYIYYNVTINNSDYCTGSPASGYILEDTSITWSTVTPPTNVRYSFSDTDSTVTSKSSGTVTAAGQTISAPATYIWYNVTVSGTNCSANVSSGYRLNGTTITWTVTNNYYSFNAGTTQKATDTATINGPGTYSKSATNYKAAAINNSSYATATQNTSTYYASGTNITWTAGANYSFGGTLGDTTTTGPITAGGTFNAPSPNYEKCTISGTRCTADKSSGSTLAIGTTITWTASDGYSFAAGTSQTATATAAVVLGTLSYSKSADYKYITVNNNSTYTTCDTATGYRHLGDTITWTRKTGTNIKYSFSNASADSTTSTATITTGTSTYNAGTIYTWYNVTISPASGYSANKSSGYLLNGSAVTFTAPANTDTKRYSFSSSDSTTHDQNKTVSSAGQTLTNDTAYVWMNCTFSGSNLATKPSNGWYRVGTSQAFTATTATNTKYAFVNTTNTWADSYASTSVTIADGTTSYTKNASYVYYNVTITKNSGTASANYSSGYLLNGTTVTFTATANTTNTKYSYSSTSADSHTQSITVSSAGQSISSGTVYTWYNVTISPASGYSADKVSGYLLNGSTVTFTAPANTDTKRYSFSSSDSSVHTQGKTVSSAGQTLANDTAYVWMNCTCNGTNCTATGGWKRVGTSITWTANSGTNYKYSFTNTSATSPTTSTTSTVVDGTSSYSKTASYIYYNVTVSPASGYSANYSSGYILNGTSITFTAPTNTSTKRYSFSTSDSTVHTQAKSVSSAGQTIANDTAYVWMNCTCTGTNCSATSGWYRAGTNITWTASSGTNYKYSFTNTSATSPTTTTTSTVVDGTTAYSKTASYVYYNVTISPTSGYSANYSSGYILNGTAVTFTAPSNTDSKRYSFSTSDSTVHTQDKTVSSAGQTLSNDTAYVWMNCTFSGSNTATKPSNGWYRVGTSQSFTASTATNTKYSFTDGNATWSDSYASTSVTIADGTTSYTKNASYVYYNVTITKNTGTASANYSSGYLKNGTTVTFTATTNTDTVRYSYSDSASDTHTKSYTVSSAGQSVSSPTVYTWYYVKISATNSTAHKGSASGTAITSGSSAWYISGQAITWTPAANYSFAEHATTAQNTSATISSATALSKSPGYGYVAVTKVRCTGIDTGYRAIGSTTFTANSNCAYSSDGSTTTEAKTVAAGGTISSSANYIYVTIQAGSNNSGVSPSAGSKWVEHGSSCTWTSATYYSYDAGSTKTNKTVSLTSPGGTYSYSPSNIKAASITANYCTADKNASTYYASGTQITWTADSSHSFAGSAVSDTRSGKTTIAAGGSYSMTPGYTKCTISGANCTFSPASGSILKNGNDGVTPAATITWTANTGYHFGSSQSTTTATATVTAATTSYSKAASVNYYTVTFTAATGLSGKSAGSWSAGSIASVPYGTTWSTSGSTVTLSGSLGSSAYTKGEESGYNTTYTISSTSGTVTGNTTITGTTNYPQVYITASGTRCAGTSGWYNRSSTATSMTFTANENCSFGGTTAQDTHSVSFTPDTPKTVSDTAGYIYVTIGGSNNASIVKYGTSTTASTGFHVYNQRLTYNPATYYSYSSGTTQTSKSDVYLTTAGGTYSYSPGYVAAASITTDSYSTKSAHVAGTYYAIGTQVTYNTVSNLIAYAYNERTGTAIHSTSQTITAGAEISAPDVRTLYVYVERWELTRCTLDSMRPTGSLPTGWLDRTNFVTATFSTTETYYVFDYAKSLPITTYNLTLPDILSEIISPTLKPIPISVSSLGVISITAWYNLCASNHTNSYIASISPEPPAIGSALKRVYLFIIGNNYTTTAATNYAYNSTGTTTTKTITIDDSEYTTNTPLNWLPTYVNVTSLSGTNCTAKVGSSSSSAAYTTGWKRTTATIYWHVTSTNYAFSASGSIYTSATPVGGVNSKSATYGKLTATGTHCAKSDPTATYLALSGSPYTVTWTADANYAFDSSGTITATTTNVTVPASISKSADFCSISISATRCKALIIGYVSRETSWSGYVPNGSTLYWVDPDQYYVIDSDTETITGPGSYSKTASPQTIMVNKARIGVSAKYRGKSAPETTDSYTYGGYPNFTNIYGMECANPGPWADLIPYSTLEKTFISTAYNATWLVLWQPNYRRAFVGPQDAYGTSYESAFYIYYSTYGEYMMNITGIEFTFGGIGGGYAGGDKTYVNWTISDTNPHTFTINAQMMEHLSAGLWMNLHVCGKIRYVNIYINRLSYGPGGAVINDIGWDYGTSGPSGTINAVEIYSAPACAKIYKYGDSSNGGLALYDPLWFDEFRYVLGNNPTSVQAGTATSGYDYVTATNYVDALSIANYVYLSDLGPDGNMQVVINCSNY